MNNKRLIENKLDDAHQAIGKVFGNGEVPSEYRNKMSAFGSAVITNGVLPTMYYYLKNDDKVVTLLRMMDEKHRNLSNKGYLNSISNMELDEKRKFTNNVLAYSTSLKLAFNFYIKKD